METTGFGKKAVKGVLVLVFAFFVAGGVFAQDKSDGNHKHEAFDMLVGVGMELSFGVSPVESIFCMDLGVGVNYDFYIFSWLSLGTGLTVNNQLLFSGFEYGIFLTVPLSVHFNIPYAEWLYLGAGVGFNIPIAHLPPAGYSAVTDSYYTSLPIDIGFDFTRRESREGARLFFRLTPNFYNTLSDELIKPKIDYGWFVQFKNFKIFSKN